MASLAYSATAPIEHPAVTKQRLHQRLTVLIDRLVTALDDIDGDPDLEPSLAHPEVPAWDSQFYSANFLPIGGPEWTDLEESADDEGSADDDDDQVDGEHDGDQADTAWPETGEHGQ